MVTCGIAGPICKHMAGPPPKPWPTGIAEQVEPLVRRVLAPNPSPYTYTGTETYVVGAAANVAVIDPGPAEPAHLEALLSAIGEAKIAAIMCTHTLRDHSPASRPLAERTGAPIVGCAPLVLDECRCFTVHAPWLTLRGLGLVYARNAPAGGGS